MTEPGLQASSILCFSYSGCVVVLSRLYHGCCGFYPGSTKVLPRS